MNIKEIYKELEVLVGDMEKFFKASFKNIPPPVMNAPAPTGSAAFTYDLSLAILHYNNGLAAFKILDVLVNPIKGATIHKINFTTASSIAQTQVQSCGDTYPISFLNGCLGIESALDPNAENKNLGPAGSNPTNDEAGYDEGIAQIKLKYLSISGSDVSLNAKFNYTRDISKAIPYHIDVMKQKIAWAENVIKTNTATPDKRLKNKYALATGAYNFGETGMLKIYEAGTFPSHCQHVIDIERSFAKILSIPSVFTDIT